jgi:nucleotide-binding universal stress UspA family protein
MEGNRILVPVSGDAVDVEVVKLACDIAKRSKAKIYAIYVIRVKRSLPLDAELEPEARRGEEVLSRAEDVAAEEGCEIETDMVQAREVGPAIVEEVAERNINLLVLGMTYRKRFGEFNLGETVPYVLKNVPCQVILCREPVAPRTASEAGRAAEEGEAE